jgi:pentatricopeptide repeat protein
VRLAGDSLWIRDSFRPGGSLPRLCPSASFSTQGGDSLVLRSLHDGTLLCNAAIPINEAVRSFSSKTAAAASPALRTTEDSITRANAAVDQAAASASPANAVPISALARASSSLAQELTAKDLLLPLGQPMEGDGISSLTSSLTEALDGIRDARMLAATVSRINTTFLLPLAPFKAIIEGSNTSQAPGSLPALLPTAAELLPLLPGITSLLNGILMFAARNGEFSVASSSYQSLKDLAAVRECLEQTVATMTRQKEIDGKRSAKKGTNKPTGPASTEQDPATTAALEQLSAFFSSASASSPSLPIGSLEAPAANAWLRACYDAGKFSEASALLDSMLSRGLLPRPDSATLSTVIDLASAQDDFRKVTSLWLLFTIGQPPKRKPVFPLADSYCSYALAAGRAGLRKEALAVLDRMRVNGLLPAPASVYAACMRACVLTDRPQMALSLFDDLLKASQSASVERQGQEEGLEECHYTLATAAAAIPWSPGSISPEEEVLGLIRTHRPSPSMRTWLGLVYASALRGGHQRAQEWLEEARATLLLQREAAEAKVKSLKEEKPTARSTRELRALEKRLKEDEECLRGCYDLVLRAISTKGAAEALTPTAAAGNTMPAKPFNDLVSRAEKLFHQMTVEDHLSATQSSVASLIRLHCLNGDWTKAMQRYQEATTTAEVSEEKRLEPTMEVLLPLIRCSGLGGDPSQLQVAKQILEARLGCPTLESISASASAAAAAAAASGGTNATPGAAADAAAAATVGGRNVSYTPFSINQSSSASPNAAGAGGATGSLLRPTLQVLNAYAQACADVGDSTEAAGVLLRLHALGLDPDSRTFEAIIVASVKSNDVQTGTRAVVAMEANRISVTERAHIAVQAAGKAEAAKERKITAMKKKISKAKEDKSSVEEIKTLEAQLKQMQTQPEPVVLPTVLPSVRELLPGASAVADDENYPYSSLSFSPLLTDASSLSPLAALARQKQRLLEARQKVVEQEEQEKEQEASSTSSSAVCSAFKALTADDDGDANNNDGEEDEQEEGEEQIIDTKELMERFLSGGDDDSQGGEDDDGDEDGHAAAAAAAQKAFALESLKQQQQNNNNSIRRERPQLPLDLELHLRATAGLGSNNNNNNAATAYYQQLSAATALSAASSSSSSTAGARGGLNQAALTLLGGSSQSSSWSLLSLAASSSSLSSSALGDRASSYGRNDASRSLLPMELLVGGPAISNKNKNFQEKGYSGGFGRFPSVDLRSSGKNSDSSGNNLPHLTLPGGEVVPVPRGLRPKSQAEVRHRKLAGIRGDLMPPPKKKQENEAGGEAEAEEEVEVEGIKAMQRSIRYSHVEKKRLKTAQKFSERAEEEAAAGDEEEWDDEDEEEDEDEEGGGVEDEEAQYHAKVAARVQREKAQQQKRAAASGDNTSSPKANKRQPRQQKQSKASEAAAAAATQKKQDAVAAVATKEKPAATTPRTKKQDRQDKQERGGVKAGDRQQQPKKKEAGAVDNAAPTKAHAAAEVNVPRKPQDDKVVAEQEHEEHEEARLARIQAKYANTGGRRGRRLAAKRYALIAVAKGLAGPVGVRSADGDDYGDDMEIPEGGLIDEENYPGEVVFDGDKPLYDGPLSDDDDDDDDGIDSGSYQSAGSAARGGVVIKAPEKSSREKQKAYARAAYGRGYYDGAPSTTATAATTTTRSNNTTSTARARAAPSAPSSGVVQVDLSLGGGGPPAGQPPTRRKAMGPLGGLVSSSSSSKRVPTAPATTAASAAASAAGAGPRKRIDDGPSRLK